MSVTFNPVHQQESEAVHDDNQIEIDQTDHDEEDEDLDHGNHNNHHAHHSTKKEVLESFDFTDSESISWRQHQFRRYFQSQGIQWTDTRVTTFWKWSLVVVTGVAIGCTGAFVAVLTEALTEWKFESCYKLMEEGNQGGAFFAFQFISAFLILISGALCYREPAAAGSGIPEIIAFLNGVNMDNVVRMPVLVAKVLGMCFSCAAGLPLGKEGPMIHAGSIIGAAVSQGKTINFGYDKTWNVFQDLRNDYTKRDFVTFGAAAGIAAAFRAPIGGILFTLEEGASFWSNNTTFRAFMCAAITQLTVGLIFPETATSAFGMFAFGQFDNLYDGRANYRVYELICFLALGALGGVLGAFFNWINEKVSLYRKAHINKDKRKRMVELVVITLMMSFISFILPLCWQHCTEIPEAQEDMHSKQEITLLSKLVPFQCPEGKYNQLASLYFTSGDLAMRQLFHFREVDGMGLNTFTSGPIILFFVPYFLMAAITSGALCPAGLFVPTLLSGAALGRLFGHWLNLGFPGKVADSGTYALIGAAAILGGMGRMTIAGCVIVLEACGNITYLLPLMVTFAAARYVGNAINVSMYHMQLHVKEMPYLEASLHTLGMLNYQPVSIIMTHPVVTIYEVDKVSRILDILSSTKHNGFPVVSKEGKLRGLILRKTLVGLLKLGAFSCKKTNTPPQPDGGFVLESISTAQFEALEKCYPNFPTVKDLKIGEDKYSYWLDVRTHMDVAPIALNKDTTIHRSYHLFRTMGLRHLILVDGELCVVGIITRCDVDEHHLHHFWDAKKNDLQGELKINNLPLAIGYETKVSEDETYSNVIDDPYVDEDVLEAERQYVPDSPTTILRKSFK